MSSFSPVRLFLAALILGLAGCGGGGGGGGAAGGLTAGIGSAGSVRMVALDRRALSPSATPRVWLLAERPAGALGTWYALEESADGIAYAPPATVAAPTILDRSVNFELPMPPGPRWYRLGGLLYSTPVQVDPGSTAAGAGATTLRAVADADGTILSLATDAGALFIEAAPLTRGATYLRVEVPIDAQGYGGAAGSRAEFVAP